MRNLNNVLLNCRGDKVNVNYFVMREAFKDGLSCLEI